MMLAPSYVMSRGSNYPFSAPGGVPNNQRPKATRYVTLKTIPGFTSRLN